MSSSWEDFENIVKRGMGEEEFNKLSRIANINGKMMNYCLETDAYKNKEFIEYNDLLERCLDKFNTLYNEREDLRIVEEFKKFLDKESPAKDIIGVMSQDKYLFTVTDTKPIPKDICFKAKYHQNTWNIFIKHDEGLFKPYGTLLDSKKVLKWDGEL